jgi:hypothetical protein
MKEAPAFAKPAAGEKQSVTFADPFLVEDAGFEAVSGQGP